MSASSESNLHPVQANDLSQQFVQFALEQGVLKFGDFVTKSGRHSPYFFNAGLFNNGYSAGKLAQFFAQTLHDSGVAFDMLFGPAYKGISLAATTAVAYSSRFDCAIPYAFNRKEAKDHGEGGTLVGAPLQGKVVIIDDVITAGTSVNEAVSIIRQAGAEVAAILIALNRMEKAGNAEQLTAHSAVEEVQQRYGVPVISIADLNDIMALLDGSEELADYRSKVAAYRDQYGVK
ncbi:orotate phosphoribosyltransferase [Brackiella oedipodis]|uniref:orotate phosphoribosyltransferase n=1 Tax=Brackiella oedipodis TaxID=124225 RepID=UPI00056F4501|nr:orotate phosphoribosyltransferase [Brackiella oedipodis]